MVILFKSKTSKTIIYVITILLLYMSCNAQAPAAAEEIYKIKSIVVNGASFRMIRIPAGEFIMGSPSNEKDRENDEGPQHRVRLNSFWMGETEVTQGLWKVEKGMLILKGICTRCGNPVARVIENK